MGNLEVAFQQQKLKGNNAAQRGHRAIQK